MKIKIAADEGVSFTVMFEPSGMTYDLGPGQFMFAELRGEQLAEMEIVQWSGGVSIWPPGSVVTLASDGAVLDSLP